MASTMPDGLAAPPSLPKPGLVELFTAFAIIALSGFGGVLAWSRRMVVEEKRWMSAEEFNEAYALCQFLPGPNIVNFSVVFGSRIRGPVGAGVALFGLMGPPVAIVIAFAVLYAQFGEIDALRRMLAGVAAAAAGLIIGTAVKMAQPLFRGGFSLGPLVLLATFVAIGVMRWPLPAVLAGLVPVSIFIAWWERR
jgi:chromate transporter